MGNWRSMVSESDLKAEARRANHILTIEEVMDLANIWSARKTSAPTSEAKFSAIRMHEWYVKALNIMHQRRTRSINMKEV